MKFKQYRKIARSVSGIVLEIKGDGSGVGGNVFEVADILGGDVVISRSANKKSYLTWMSDNESYVAHDGDLLIFDEKQKFIGIVHPEEFNSSWEEVKEYNDQKNNNVQKGGNNR